MSALRRALHQAVDLILDAIEEDKARPPKAPTKPPRRTKERPPIAPRDTSHVSPELREKVLWTMRKNGIL